MAQWRLVVLRPPSTLLPVNAGPVWAWLGEGEILPCLELNPGYPLNCQSLCQLLTGAFYKNQQERSTQLRVL